MCDRGNPCARRQKSAPAGGAGGIWDAGIGRTAEAGALLGAGETNGMRR
jgi:hypothetical protein